MIFREEMENQEYLTAKLRKGLETLHSSFGNELYLLISTENSFLFETFTPRPLKVHMVTVRIFNLASGSRNEISN